MRPRYGPLSVLGLTPGDVAEWVETAMMGHPVGQWWQEGRAYDIVVRYPERYRADLDALANASILLWRLRLNKMAREFRRFV